MTVQNVEEARKELDKAIDDAEDEVLNRFEDFRTHCKERQKEWNIDYLIDKLENVDKNLPLCVTSDQGTENLLTRQNPKKPGLFFEIIDEQGTCTKDHKGRFWTYGRKEIIVYANNKRRNGKLKDFYFLETVQDLFDIVFNPLKGQDFKLGVLNGYYNRGWEMFNDIKYATPYEIAVKPYYLLDCGVIVTKQAYDKYKNGQCTKCAFYNTCDCSRFSYYHNEWRPGYGRNPHRYYYGSAKPIEVLEINKGSFHYDDTEDFQLEVYSCLEKRNGFYCYL